MPSHYVYPETNFYQIHIKMTYYLMALQIGFFIYYILELNIMANNVTRHSFKLLLKNGSNDCHEQIRREMLASDILFILLNHQSIKTCYKEKII